jgi:hypothetical protein
MQEYLTATSPASTQRVRPGPLPSNPAVINSLTHLDARGVLRLQRTAGNAAVAGLLRERQQQGIFPDLALPIQRGGAISTATGRATHGGGRGYAMQLLNMCPPGTNGHVMLHAISPFWTVFGNLASGTIGLHYQGILPLLMQPASHRSLIRIALGETAWWRLQVGLPGSIGSLMSARMRASILVGQARRLGVLPPPRP